MAGKKHKRGDVRKDGMVFVALHKRYKSGEHWVTKEKFDAIKKQELANRERKKKLFASKEKTLNKGDLREIDDKIFWQYGVSYKNFEQWVSPEAYAKNKRYHVDYKKSSKHKEYARKYVKSRCNKDPLYRLAKNTRVRTIKAFKNKAFSKRSSTAQMLGCSFEELKQHIEKQFTEGMSWNNIGDWQVDHKLPLASAKTTEELNALCHHTNLQPLWAEDNIRKSDECCPHELKSYLAQMLIS